MHGNDKRIHRPVADIPQRGEIMSRGDTPGHGLHPGHRRAKPNPGSDEAMNLGCTCPRMDNCHGKGINGDGRLFWINQKCPVHGKATHKKE